jgi:hypothetical protein
MELKEKIIQQIDCDMIFFFGPTDISGGTYMMISLPTVVGLLFLGNSYLIKPSKYFFLNGLLYFRKYVHKFGVLLN